jgi:glycosyltransferase involved in cell wall biosynthesis
MKVFAITPVFNRLLLTIKCVESLLAQNADIEIDILIIDDGSTDGTGDYFKNFGHGVKLIRGDGSLYWGGAINLGLK